MLESSIFGNRKEDVSTEGPSWIGIGAQRCGTTWFTDLLVQHPLMDVAAGKKEHHWLYQYGLTREWTPAARDEYRSRFASGDVKLGEFTPYYLRASWICALTADAIADNAPILVLVRDPVDRFASALRHEMELAIRRRRKYLKRTKVDKGRGNDVRPGRLLRVATEGSKKLRQKVQRPGAVLPKNILGDPEVPIQPPNAFWDRTWLRFVGSDAAWGGMYAAHLDAWTDFLPEERFIVIQYERLRENPQHYTDLVWSRLGLDPLPLTQIDRRSRSSTRTEHWRPEDHPHVVRALQHIYLPDAERLASRWDIDLELWKRTTSQA
jgi:hypothetical protein